VAAASSTAAKKWKQSGVDLHRWGTSKSQWRLLAVIERAKRESTLTQLSPHWGLEITEAEAEARIRLDAERKIIAKTEKRIQEKLDAGRLTEKEKVEKRRGKHRAQYRAKRAAYARGFSEDDLDEIERLDEIAEVMAA
jgi:hypothetical protein